MDAPAAGVVTGKIVSADDQQIASPVLREDKIATLLARGQHSLSESRLLTPAGDNANYYFKEVLALDPGNTDARQGFNRIAERYVILASRAKERHNNKLARVYITRGLHVRPDNKDLLALQDSLRKPPNTPGKTITKLSPAAEPQQQQPGFFSRLKSLFSGNKDEPAEVVDRSVMSVNH
jgi:hypothetical protein